MFYGCIYELVYLIVLCSHAKICVIETVASIQYENFVVFFSLLHVFILC